MNQLYSRIVGNKIFTQFFYWQFKRVKQKDKIIIQNKVLWIFYQLNKKTTNLENPLKQLCYSVNELSTSVSSH